jgi:hypothetical protein
MWPVRSRGHWLSVSIPPVLHKLVNKEKESILVFIESEI